MPQKLRFTLEGEPPQSPFQHSTGLRAVLLRWLAESDADLATAIHDANQTKPYTIGPIWAESGAKGKSWFEVALLADWLREPLLAGFHESQPEVRLGSQVFRIRDPQIREQATWEQLLRPPPPGLRGFSLRLLTPTAHHTSGVYRKSIVLPSPELYFGSWLGRWNVCSEQRIGPGLLELIERQVAITACSGSTRAIRTDQNRLFIGFEGSVRFSLLKPETLSPEERTVLAALARFAEFCGTGVDTMRGMGQTALDSFRE